MRLGFALVQLVDEQIHHDVVALAEGDYRRLLELRRTEIVPRRFGPGRYRMLGERAFEVAWEGGLTLLANCGTGAVDVETLPAGRCFWGSEGKTLEAWSASWWLAE